MTIEHAEDRTTPRKPPSIAHVLAVFVELSIVAGVIHSRSWLTLLLCVVYLYWSATLALFFGS